MFLTTINTFPQKEIKIENPRDFKRYFSLWARSDNIGKYDYHITEKYKCGETDTLFDL